MKEQPSLFQSENSPVFIGAGSLESLSGFMLSETYGTGKLFVLTDENTFKACYPLLCRNVPALAEAGVITVSSGEAHKNIRTVERIWERLMAENADRNAALVCLGGGVVSDFGGFAAATFKRGIRFIHVPTSLMGMADAALGGKTGVNVNDLKNQAGLFIFPQGVFVHPGFLKTLPAAHMKSGWAEVLKYGLIASRDFWNAVKNLRPEDIGDWENILMECAVIKTQIVREDFRENGVRRKLNFGHTLGHAFETWSLRTDELPLTHGEAVAAGMVCETYLSQVLCGLDSRDAAEVRNKIVDLYGKYRFPASAFGEILEVLRTDKKNSGGTLRFTLIDRIGNADCGVNVTGKQVEQCLEFYCNLAG